MNKRYLIFSKPIVAQAWTQTINAGEASCYGFPTLEQAEECVREQQINHPGWVSIIREVELPRMWNP